MTEDRARDGLVHLQAAAIELIAAGRAFLDVAEELVREPAALAAVLQAARAMTGVPTPEPPSADARNGDREGAADTEGVTRIRVT